MIVYLGDKKYNLKEARTLFLKNKGLLGITSLASDEGMLFYFDPPLLVTMWMKDTKIPLDIIFINEDYDVTKVQAAKPNDLTKISLEDTAYVVEVNQGSGIKEGDKLDLDEDDEPVMKVLFPDGSEQMPLWGGERIVSRVETKVIIKKAKKAYETKKDSDYKALGRYIFKVLKKLDTREPEYVSTKL